MDDFEDFFSAEALQLWANDSVSSATLSQITAPIPTNYSVAETPAPQQEHHISDNQEWYPDPTHQPQEPTPVDDITGLDPFPQTKRKRKRRKHSEAIPGCLIINSTEAQGPKLKRSKFQPGRKEEVAKIRRIGACLRCRQLKISCSEIWPCPPCRRSKSSCYGRAPKFRWMDSVSCSFNRVDIYAIDSGCTSEQLTRKLKNCEAIDFGDVELAFESEVLWDLDAMVSEFAGWMSDKHALPASTSRVGILSSAKFTELIRTIADEDLTRTFRLLVESSSVLYNYNGQPDFFWKDYDMDDLESIRSFAGTSVLRHLERVLSNITLAKTSLKEMKALFLILFGTIIAIGYSQPIGHNEEPGSSPRSYGEAQQQLLQILAHHMVQIAERTSILDQEADRIRLIERANQLWDRQAMFEWDMVDVSSCNSGIISDGDSIDEERSGSGFNSPLSEDVVTIDLTEPDQPNTRQQPPDAEELFAYQTDPFLNPSSATCLLCVRSLSAESGVLCDYCGQYSLGYATDKLQHAQASVDTPAPSLHSPFEWKLLEGRFQCLPYDANRQCMQRSRCLICNITAMRPGATFCSNCAYLSACSVADCLELPSGVEATKKAASICDRKGVCHGRCLRPEKTAEESRQDFVQGWPEICQNWGPVAPRHMQFDVSSSPPLQGTASSANAGICRGQEPHHDRDWVTESWKCFLPRSNGADARDNKNMTNKKIGRPKNLLV